MPRAPRTCAFRSMIDGQACPNLALSRQAYCRVHYVVHEAAGAVGGAFVSELLGWFAGRQEPHANTGGAAFEKMIEELLRELRQAQTQPPPRSEPRRILNYYKVLGVVSSAVEGQIKSAFRRIAFECHPDRNPEGTPGRADRIKKFKQAAEAYQCLSDPKRRREYDALLRYARPVQGEAP